MLEKFLVSLEISGIKTYRKISSPIYSFLDYFHINPFKCGFSPSCSHYSEEAIKEWGAYKGSILAFKRILKCNHVQRIIHDPVPKKEKNKY